MMDDNLLRQCSQLFHQLSLIFFKESPPIILSESIVSIRHYLSKKLKDTLSERGHLIHIQWMRTFVSFQMRSDFCIKLWWKHLRTNWKTNFKMLNVIGVPYFRFKKTYVKTIYCRWLLDWRVAEKVTNRTLQELFSTTMLHNAQWKLTLNNQNRVYPSKIFNIENFSH